MLAGVCVLEDSVVLARLDVFAVEQLLEHPGLPPQRGERGIEVADVRGFKHISLSGHAKRRALLAGPLEFLLLFVVEVILEVVFLHQTQVGPVLFEDFTRDKREVSVSLSFGTLEIGDFLNCLLLLQTGVAVDEVLVEGLDVCNPPEVIKLLDFLDLVEELHFFLELDGAVLLLSH